MFDDLVPNAAPADAGGAQPPVNQSASGISFDDLVPPKADVAPQGNAISDVWPEIKSAASTAAGTVADTLNPFSEARHAAYAKQAAAPAPETSLNPLTAGITPAISEEAKQVADTGKGLLAVPQVAAAPFTGAARSLLGHPLATAEHVAGEIINPEVAYKDNPAEMYATAKGDVDTAMSALSPARGGLSALVRGPVPIPPQPTGPFGITLSAGEEAGDLAMRQAEQAAIRGADPHAKQWVAQRAAQIEQANKDIVQGLDPLGQTIAQTPQEAGALVSQGVQSAAGTAKAAVAQAYQQARAMPGEIHAGVFEGMSQGIKGDVSLGDNPVIIDDKTTPFASKMIDDLDNRISQLKIQNKADPFGPPNPEDITGVNLTGVDQMRKRLSAFRKDAYASGNAADGRAAQAVLDSFDDRIDQAVNNGLFTGDKSAVNAWNNARAAYSDYRSTFTAGRNDPVGRVVQKIIGDNINDPLTPGKVMDQLVGSSKVNPSSLNIGVANRLKSILGETSPQWVAAKQDVARSLMQSGEGESALGTGQVAQRLSKFLNSDMAPVIYSPQEQATLRSYANLMRQITMPPGSYFPSAPGINKIVSVVANRIGAVIGGLIGRTLVPGMPLVGELGGLTIGSHVEKALERMHSNVAKQLPLVSQQMKKWQKAVAAVNKTNSPPSRMAESVAALNLSHSLAPLGISLQNIAAQGPGTAQATPNQQNIPRPPSQQKNGGAIDQKNRASGGMVQGCDPDSDGNPESQEKSDWAAPQVDISNNDKLKRANGGAVGFHPSQIGARQAPDGKWYVKDPKRPGKYLKVVHSARPSIH